MVCVKKAVFCLFLIKLTSMLIVGVNGTNLLIPREIMEQKAEVFKVGVYNNKPLIFSEEEEIKGIYKDVLNHIEANENWKFEYVQDDWNNLLQALNEGEIDVVTAIAYSSQRSKYFVFTDEGLIINWGLLVCNPRVKVESIINLENRTVGVLENDIHYIGVEGIKNLTRSFEINCSFIEYSSYEAIYSAVSEQEIDVGAVNRFFAATYDGNHRVVETAIYFNPVDNKFAFCKNSTSATILKPKFDQYLRNLKKDKNSIFYDSKNKWFGIEPKFVKIIPDWLILITLVCIILLIVIIVFNILLRSNVARQTRELAHINVKLSQANNQSKLLQDLMIHDLNNILHILGMTVNLQNLNLDGIEAADITKKMLKQIDRANTIISNVKTLIEKDKDRGTERVNLVEIINELKQGKMMEYLGSKIDFEVVLTTIDEKLFVRGGKHIKIALDKIIENSIVHNKYINKIIKVEISSIQKKVENFYKVIITDNAGGIPDDIISNLLNENSELDRTARMGLGLYLAIRLIKANDGTVLIENYWEKGKIKGARVIIFLKRETD